MHVGQRAVVGGMAAVAVVASIAWLILRPSVDARLLQARRALAARNFAQAESLALSVARRSGSDPRAWMVAGQAAAAAGNWAASLQHYEQVIAGSSSERSTAAYGRGEACVQLTQYARAEREFLQSLDFDPQHDLSRRRLADLLLFTGRRHRARVLLEQLIPSPHGTWDDLFHLADVDHLVSRSAKVFAGAHEPTADPVFVSGAAFQALQDGRPAESLPLFERALQSRPDDVDALAGYGEAVWQVSPEQIPDWRKRLTPQSLKDAGVLAVLAEVAERNGRQEVACRLLARVVLQRPTSRIAWYRWGTALGRVGRSADSIQALQRAKELQQLGTWMDDLFGRRQQPSLLRRVAERLAKLDRAIEAQAWCRHALNVLPQELWAKQLMARLDANPHELTDKDTEQELQQVLKEFSPQLSDHDLESLWKPVELAGQPMPTTAETARIRFVDAAPKTGLDFTFHSARDPATPGSRIIETTGGGVGVLDYDLDGWPDLYFSQGSRMFPFPTKNPDHDRLFRNQLGLAWRDVSVAAHLEDDHFGQGVAVGDFDNDGFPDLYVANYGVNCLYHNLGDGTFADVTPQSMRQQPVWTSSCVIADLNRDGQPDLFDVTYCRGREVETRMCDKQGVPRSCSPRVFGAEADRVWINAGDGAWELTPDEVLNQPTGLGLGLVVFRPDAESPLSVFVANDEESNSWFINSSIKPGSKPAWEDRALGSGLAVDGDGQAQACMGIACDDANGDGWPDLFVTNFYHESNTLYLSQSSSLFEDRTRAAGLRAPSWEMLGFGTQFLDADLDGWPDLLVANGHIDDLTAAGEPFAMRPQCFWNRGTAFQELTAALAGECFDKPALGRGMARLDWNRDGREDAVIVNQDSPASLLTNDSKSSGHSLVLRLRGRSGARDAIGTIVRVHIGARVLTRQLTAGDGYQASNERQLVIGLGQADTADRLEIFWPDGPRQEVQDLTAGHQYLVIESQRPWRLR